MKFKIYDKVLVLYGSKIETYTIYKRGEEAISSGTTEKHYTVGKNFNKPLEWGVYKENELFATKKELLDSL